MRTPWKVLYDFATAFGEQDWGPAWQLHSLAWVVLVFGPIVAVTWLVYVFASWVAPAAPLSQLLDAHFWTIVIVLSVAFFFYWFFRLVWDGLKVPTTPPQPRESDR